jgi:CDP-glucose 4,6-dehydratase
MLQMQGHEVSGISLNPEKKSLFAQCELDDIFKYDLRIDIRNKKNISGAINIVNPEVIIHLAAQSLVGNSYDNPIETFETNVMGTLNILETSRNLSNLKAILIVTTDKVYKNHESIRGFVESDALGGGDPYSASKAAADIAAQSWIKSFGLVPICIARAGNVVGGGDWASNRIIPDLVNAFSKNEPVSLRNPKAIRPWQHVLDCLNGYLILIQEMLNSDKTGEWNFGPSLEETYSVEMLVEGFARDWGLRTKSWVLDSKQYPGETSQLLLNSDKSRQLLNWRDLLSFEQTIQLTVAWYKEVGIGNFREVTLKQIAYFMDLQKLESKNK